MPKLPLTTKHDVKTTINLHREARTVEIEVVDAVSGCRMFELTLSQDTFFDNLGLHAYQPASLVQYHGPIGYRHETKTEVVTIPEKLQYLPESHDAKLDATLAPFEVDGWSCARGSGADYRNHHRSKRNGQFNVSFHRYVHPETGEPWTL